MMGQRRRPSLGMDGSREEGGEGKERKRVDVRGAGEGRAGGSKEEARAARPVRCLARRARILAGQLQPATSEMTDSNASFEPELKLGVYDEFDDLVSDEEVASCYRMPVSRTSTPGEEGRVVELRCAPQSGS